MGPRRTLRELCEAAGLSEAQLGRKLVMTAARVVAWEAGRLRPTRLQLDRMPPALGVREGAVRAAVAEGEGTL